MTLISILKKSKTIKLFPFYLTLQSKKSSFRSHFFGFFLRGCSRFAKNFAIDAQFYTKIFFATNAVIIINIKKELLLKPEKFI